MSAEKDNLSLVSVALEGRCHCIPCSSNTRQHRQSQQLVHCMHLINKCIDTFQSVGRSERLIYLMLYTDCRFTPAVVYRCLGHIKCLSLVPFKYPHFPKVSNKIGLEHKHGTDCTDMLPACRRIFNNCCIR